jgi:hypothetical protein
MTQGARDPLHPGLESLDLSRAETSWFARLDEVPTSAKAAEGNHFHVQIDEFNTFNITIKVR